MKCPLQRDKLICIDCCKTAHSLLCDDCRNYLDKGRLFFHCPSCEATEDGNETDMLARHLHISLFPALDLEGPISDKGELVSGEGYQTKLDFPFDGLIYEPFWLLVQQGFDPDSIQFVCVEIINILNRDRYKAQVEILTNQVIPLARVPQVFPGAEMKDTPPDPTDVFALPVTVESIGTHTICRSLCQDGGTWAVFTDTNSGPALVLYARGWFNHWKYFGGHLRLALDFYHRLLRINGPIELP